MEPILTQFYSRFRPDFRQIEKSLSPNRYWSEINALRMCKTFKSNKLELDPNDSMNIDSLIPYLYTFLECVLLTVMTHRLYLITIEI